MLNIHKSGFRKDRLRRIIWAEKLILLQNDTMKVENYTGCTNFSPLTGESLFIILMLSQPPEGKERRKNMIAREVVSG